MSNKNNASARGIHVSPGIYTSEEVLTYAVKSLGITTLGLVGETLKGPAFQPMLIENWRDFQSMFGGTSPEKFSGSQYPKYELPYVAKSYLTESNQLQVCRVLGLSGYNAGPAWVITASKKGNVEASKIVVAVIRSRGYYESHHQVGSGIFSCSCPSTTYDSLFYRVGEFSETTRDCTMPKHYNMKALRLQPYVSLEDSGDSCNGYEANGKEEDWTITALNRGKFVIEGVVGALDEGDTAKNWDKSTDGYFKYPVSLNPADKDYILKVLGTTPSNGDTPIYVESLYDVGLIQQIQEDKINQIDSEFLEYDVNYVADYCNLEPVNDFVTRQESSLSRKDVGKRFLASQAAVEGKIKCHPYDYATKKPCLIDKPNDFMDDNVEGVQPEVEIMRCGQIYTVAQYTGSDGKRHYYYRYYRDNLPKDKNDAIDYHVQDMVTDSSALNDSAIAYKNWLVKNNADGKYYRYCENDKNVKDMYAITCDMNNYKESYRFASTPWIVSNLKGDFNQLEVNKLFRFHTISDGDNSNYEIKISIQNIKTDDGTFDVIVRDINDTDASVVVLERFQKCTLTPGDTNYIAYKIGSYDGSYESKSKYITVEVNETLASRNSSPAGFLGYPLSRFDGLQIKGEKKTVKTPYIKYNTSYDEDIKNRKQYFGLSDIVGVDVDSFTYKGQMAYDMSPDFLCDGFHLDCRVNVDDSSYYGNDNKPQITVDGVSGYTFVGVGASNRTMILDGTPIIGTEASMDNSIYEYVDLRKFTVYFYGGFDGWDIYRNYRSNTDDFKMSKYKGDYNDFSGQGYAFDKIDDPDSLALNQQGITSDFYAYLSGVRQFANPESVDINVFATPGIDLFNNTTLCQEVIEMIEEERADSIYVATVPDKPFGAMDYEDEMYSPDDMVYELEDTEIDSNYTCVYYPWVKYEDTDNSQYIYLPPTKDIVRNMAQTDNTTYPWFAPAGVDRGSVDCVRAHYITKLGDEDVLYEGRINPIKTFAVDGVKVWGQKNLQIADNQLNRIAVRRLLLRMRKLISIACIGLIFEPNDATTKQKFLSTVTPIMDSIKANRGISDYRIEVNDTLESRERRELPARIFFKPYNALEYIDIAFVVTPEGTSWDDI